MEQEGMSAAERRRAARQRKILENADSRMNRLYGRPDAAVAPAEQRDASSSPSAPASAFDPCPDPPDQSIHEVLTRSRPPTMPGWPTGLGPAPNMEDLFRQMNGGGQSGEGQGGGAGEMGAEPSLWWGRWDKYRWIVIALTALFTRLALLLGVGTTVTQNVLVPFFVLETTVYVIRLWSVPLRSNMGLLGTALMLCGVSPRTLDLWGRYITFLSQAWSDFMVYMFVLVLAFSYGGEALAAEDGTSTSDDGSKAAPPPPTTPVPDDVNFEF
ncbi:uncharacterized protein LOC122391844 [Amphibalanus amphitrite]|uniref:uncharacterized protein LOC122391844 n=1 Tax=Amphibalanus amphitrite TaxID=1232801 RepID=UPI001C924054|nr:uncharacterized protein LOC122391844 [Amphibalanus amphitrite]XP_043242081.1 uncharacterized protein LOC122391844 [Amphibalanus amphitrite]